jgi:hypothetical protein
MLLMGNGLEKGVDVFWCSGKTLEIEGEVCVRV